VLFVELDRQAFDRLALGAQITRLEILVGPDHVKDLDLVVALLRIVEIHPALRREVVEPELIGRVADRRDIATVNRVDATAIVLVDEDLAHVQRLVEQRLADDLADPHRARAVFAFLANVLMRLDFKAGVRRIARGEQPIRCVRAPALDSRQLHEILVGEGDTVPALLPRDRDPGDRGRVAVEPVERRHVEQIIDLARERRRCLVPPAGAVRIDVAINLAPRRLVERAPLFQPPVIGDDELDRFSVQARSRLFCH
jgi:hypothetical protein